MSVIKYHKPLTLGEIADRTDKAVKECTYVEFMNALENLDGKPFDRDSFIKLFRRVAAKRSHERSDFESVVLLIVSLDLEQEIIQERT